VFNYTTSTRLDSAPRQATLIGINGVQCGQTILFVKMLRICSFWPRKVVKRGLCY